MGLPLPEGVVSVCSACVRDDVRPAFVHPAQVERLNSEIHTLQQDLRAVLDRINKVRHGAGTVCDPVL